MTTDASVADAPPHTNGSSRLATVTRSFESLMLLLVVPLLLLVLPATRVFAKGGKAEKGSGRNKMTDVYVSVLVVSFSSRRQNFPHLVEPFHWLFAVS
jgi:hypothetical protein